MSGSKGLRGEGKREEEQITGFVPGLPFLSSSPKFPLKGLILRLYDRNVVKWRGRMRTRREEVRTDGDNKARCHVLLQSRSQSIRQAFAVSQLSRQVGNPSESHVNQAVSQ